MKSEKGTVKKGSMVQKFDLATFTLDPRRQPPGPRPMIRPARLAIHPASRQLLPVLGPPISPALDPPTRAILRDSRFVILSTHNVEIPS